MRSHIIQLAASVFVLWAMSASAAIRYVNVNGTSPTPPYVTWTTAATTIQDAVDVAVAGDQILVTNGVYQAGGRAVDGTTNRVAVDKPVTVQSMNGAAVTLIRGFQVPGTILGDGAMRCVHLANGAALVGFTLTNGVALYGGGVLCESSSATVSNCVLTGNFAGLGGGASGGTLQNCTLSGNSAHWVGAGASGCTLNNCTLTGNSAGEIGGGAVNSTLHNCTVTGNSAAWDGGGVEAGTLNNCRLTGNSAYGGGGASDATLNNCTITGNSASGFGGGVYGGTLNNCIVYHNHAPEGANYLDNIAINGVDFAMSYCCTTPLPEEGTANFTDAPLFVDYPGGDLRLQSNSPCINTGLNAHAPAGPDLEGNSRVGGAVDIGAYEFPSPQSPIPYAWLLRYGLPTDGSANDTDKGADGMTNEQEWRADTDPTNDLSVLRLLSLATGILGLPGSTTFTDTNAGGSQSFFYRVGVKE